jgi:hypothetical protein
MGMGKDLRKFRRIAVHIPQIICQLRPQDQTSQMRASVQDFSFGGMCVEALQPLEVGAIIEVFHRDFPCAAAHTPTSLCRVVTVQAAKGLADCYRIGLAFDPVNTEFVENMLRWAQLQKLARDRSQPRSALAAKRAYY